MKNTVKSDFQKFQKYLHELSHLSSALALITWDQAVNMPSKGMYHRADTIATLAGVVHEKFLARDFIRLLKKLKKEIGANELSEDEFATVRETWRTYELENKLPLEFVKEEGKTIGEASSVWEEAKRKSNFKIFAPYLTKLVELARQKAEYRGYRKSPYDALLKTFEPEKDTEEIFMLFEELKDFLIPFLHKIQTSKVKLDPRKLYGHFPKEVQEKFNRDIAAKIGFDFHAGRLDMSEHPFTIGLNPEDVRMTTRYSEKDILHALIGTIHEAGHALYEQGIHSKHFGTALGEAMHISMHESQSKIWENMVGKNKFFWRYVYPKVKKTFPNPYAKLGLDQCYALVNAVKPSLIRVEADEVTYNLHIILRFEIEKELIEGSIEVKDLPEIWNDKMKRYLGIRVPNDRQGVLQDMHWSGGSFGYFPSYILGNLAAAQFYRAARKQHKKIEQDMTRGNCATLLGWLRENLHKYGKKYPAEEILLRATGAHLGTREYIDYLKKKYQEIYQL